MLSLYQKCIETDLLYCYIEDIISSDHCYLLFLYNFTKVRDCQQIVSVKSSGVQTAGSQCYVSGPFLKQ